jgi:protein-glutamine gamma-glutamyltransferase
MVIINGVQINAIPSAEGFAPNPLQQSIFDIMSDSRQTYAYDSAYVLITELRLRNSIVRASRDLYRSGMSFRDFRDSKANPEFWNRTAEGGFELKGGVSPSDAIADIFRHGALYGTECSTAMIIVLYKALLDIMPRMQFNRLYSDIYLMNWQHLDLAIVIYRSAADELPGDARYFSNPDVDPLKPQWQGENAYYLGNGMYYGHGIGISDAEEMIRALNASRREGATRSAYLNDMVKRQDYSQIAEYI